MAHVIKISVDELQRAEAVGTSKLEWHLVALVAAVKAQRDGHRDGGRPVFVRIDFPRAGGLEMRCKRGWWATLMWKLKRRDVALWEREL